MMAGDASRPRTEPTWSPEKAELTALARCSLGTVRASMSTTAEGAMASPAPITDLVMQSAGRLAALRGSIAVVSDHSATLGGRVRSPPRLEDR